jgi:hypothetical protein
VKNPTFAAGYQEQPRNPVHTFFARISPRGDDFTAWNEMTPVGKVAWFWKAYNQRTLELLEELPEDCYRILQIEDLDYGNYSDLTNFLGISSTLTHADFDSLRTSRPHAFWNKRNIDQWSSQEIDEFEDQVGDIALHFGYEYRVEELLDEIRAEREEAERRLESLQPTKKRNIRFWRARCAASDWLRNFANKIDVR